MSCTGRTMALLAVVIASSFGLSDRVHADPCPEDDDDKQPCWSLYALGELGQTDFLSQPDGTEHLALTGWGARVQYEHMAYKSLLAIQAGISLGSRGANLFFGRDIGDRTMNLFGIQLVPKVIPYSKKHIDIYAEAGIAASLIRGFSPADENDAVTAKTFDLSIPVGVGVAYEFLPGLSFVLGGRVYLGVSPAFEEDFSGFKTNNFAVMANFGIRYSRGRDYDGDGVTDSKDGCTTQPGPKGNNGCPVDEDGDGIFDDYNQNGVVDGDDDRCPELKEDGRAPLTEDGCPNDQDGDGIYDLQDKRCIGKAPWEPFPKPDDWDVSGKKYKLGEPKGCPAEFKQLQFKQRKVDYVIVLRDKKVDRFKSNSDVVLKAHEPVLVEIGKLYEHYGPYFSRLRILGHTDGEGKAKENDDLGKKRALAVRKKLRDDYDIPENWMVTGSLGEEKPTVEESKTQGMTPEELEDLKDQNRRVTFVLEP